ncbi:flagellar biosynthetic protein FliO [Rheinheimera sp. SM2107]|uniref:Flagellar protein n=2 Tax=Arsukibacterium indicum TaxID=2848612 RepID=A0ABS6MGA9_9GAMM|nr:flagellar biosynthetic protein FliO [Arsukibacterium indicum]
MVGAVPSFAADLQQQATEAAVPETEQAVDSKDNAEPATPPQAVSQAATADETATETATQSTTAAEPRQGIPFQRQELPAERNPAGGLSLTKIAISLAAVVLLVFALGWLFKKLTLRLPGSQHVKVICSVPLGQRERLLVIEIQGKQRVLGVTPQSINMLFELENSLPETKLASDFHTQLQSFLKK